MKLTGKITAAFLAATMLLAGTAVMPMQMNNRLSITVSAEEEEEKNFTDGETYSYDYIENNNGVVIVSAALTSEKMVIPSKIDGKAVTGIGDGTHRFYILNNDSEGLPKITSIVIPESVTNIGDKAFCGYTDITSVTIPNGVKRIGNSAFVGTGITEIAIPDSVTFIGDHAFCSTSLTEITVPDSVTSIGKRAFGYYDDSESFHDVNDVGHKIVTGFKINCGEGSAAEQYAIDNSFSYQLTNGSGELHENTFIISNHDKSEEDTDSSTVSLVYNGTGGDVEVPGEFEGMKVIGVSGFADCTTITSVILPDTIEYIESVSNNSAFSGCTNLKMVKLPKSINSLGNWEFANCESLSSIDIPNIGSIGDDTFSGCTSLTEIVIPTGCVSIGRGAFSGCENLKSVTILNNEISIYGSAFENCPNVIIYCGSGSAAEEFAIEQGYNYEIIDVSAYTVSTDDESSETESENDKIDNSSIAEKDDSSAVEANAGINDTRSDEREDNNDDDSDEESKSPLASIIIILIGAAAIVLTAVFTFRKKPAQYQTEAITEAGKFCGTCGTELNIGAKFCKKCGTPVSTSYNTTASKGGKSTKIFGIITIAVIILAVIMTLAAVNSGDSDRKKSNSRNSKTAEISVDTSDDELKISKETDDNAKEDDNIFSDDNSNSESKLSLTDGQAEVSNDFDELKTMFPFVSNNGKAKDSYTEMNKALEEADFEVKNLTMENIQSSDAEYTLFMYKSKGNANLSVIDGYYRVTYNTSEQEFNVICGNSEKWSYDEVSPYFSNGNEIVYYALCYEKNGEYYLMPVFAGYDEYGYYLIRSFIGFDNFDLSVMENLPSDAIIGTPLN